MTGIVSTSEPHEYGFPFCVQTLARAMCRALNIDSDETFMHGAAYSPKPTLRQKEEFGFVPAVLLHTPNWVRFCWRAQLWMYEHSGGTLPKPPDYTPDPMGL